MNNCLLKLSKVINPSCVSNQQQLHVDVSLSRVFM